MIWDGLILGLVAATVTILATTGIIAVIIDAAVTIVILVLKQKGRHIVKVSEMAATIHAAEAKDRRG